MDLTIPIGNSVLNIRVAVLVETPKGFVLEKSTLGFYFLVGGRVQVGETSLEAAKREVQEELGISLENLKLKAIIENFFSETENTSGKQVQEICFVYRSEVKDSLEMGELFAVLTPEQINSIDFRPTILKTVLTQMGDEIVHLIEK